MLDLLKLIARVLENIGYTEYLVKLEVLIFFLEDVPETISLDDVKQNPWLLDLCLLSDCVVNATDRRATDWMKSR